ncbi:Methionine aminopeptidase 1 [Larimichthys crocea]|uniref:Uncharacterized protein n=1 Tax=Larimichthys crocea TaxID=215358 RepID=A0ACD3RQY4_LARCR|nr:Methionine aminopeptidase 1 [Larimichthys crocea]
MNSYVKTKAHADPNQTSISEKKVLTGSAVAILQICVRKVSVDWTGAAQRDAGPPLRACAVQRRRLRLRRLAASPPLRLHPSPADEGMASTEARRECETEGCSKDAKLQCPTCIKLGIQGSYFCSQECFKGSWGSHKLLHKKAKEDKNQNESKNCVEKDINTDPWPGYRYTGKLRPLLPIDSHEACAQ